VIRVVLTLTSAWLRNGRDALRRRLPPGRSFDVHSLMKPPWIVAPTFPGNSMYWRMGGEQYFFAVRDMYAALTPSEQAAYDRAYPEPPDWAGYFRPARKGA
jgi:hypothetical protein